MMILLLGTQLLVLEHLLCPLSILPHKDAECGYH